MSPQTRRKTPQAEPSFPVERLKADLKITGASAADLVGALLMHEIEDDAELTASEVRDMITLFQARPVEMDEAAAEASGLLPEPEAAPEDLTGDDLDDACEAAGIDTTKGGSLADGSMSADEKRDALKASAEADNTTLTEG